MHCMHCVHCNALDYMHWKKQAAMRIGGGDVCLDADRNVDA